jgi:hypothetical protein
LEKTHWLQLPNSRGIDKLRFQRKRSVFGENTAGIVKFFWNIGITNRLQLPDSFELTAIEKVKKSKHIGRSWKLLRFGL